MEFEIIMLPPAEDDLAEIVTYLNTLSREVALQYYDAIISEIETLSTMPIRCPTCRDAFLAAKGYRVLIVEKYLVFYMVCDKTVEIHRILYGSRNYAALL